MAWTQDDIDTLKAAIATGAREVQFGAGPDARKVTYRSIAEMERVLANMIAEVSPAATKPLRTVGQYNSGFGPSYPGAGWTRNF
jgi:hypothetical protein